MSKAVFGLPSQVFKKILHFNILLLLYFITPNITSLVCVGFIVFLFSANKSDEEVDNHFNWSGEEGGLLELANQKYQEFTKKKFSQRKLYHNIVELVTLAILGFTLQIVKIFPNWLVIGMLLEMIACWDLLVQFGVSEVINGYISKGEGALEKFFALIPRYKA